MLNKLKKLFVYSGEKTDDDKERQPGTKIKEEVNQKTTHGMVVTGLPSMKSISKKAREVTTKIVTNELPQRIIDIIEDDCLSSVEHNLDKLSISTLVCKAINKKKYSIHPKVELCVDEYFIGVSKYAVVSDLDVILKYSKQNVYDYLYLAGMSSSVLQDLADTNLKIISLSLDDKPDLDGIKFAKSNQPNSISNGLLKFVLEPMCYSNIANNVDDINDYVLNNLLIPTIGVYLEDYQYGNDLNKDILVKAILLTARVFKIGSLTDSNDLASDFIKQQKDDSKTDAMEAFLAMDLTKMQSVGSKQESSDFSDNADDVITELQNQLKNNICTLSGEDFE